MKRKNFGFTLIELVVVMAIVSILMAMALVSYQGVRKSAMDGKRKADLEQIRSALEMCYSDNGEYPAAIYDDISCGGKVYFTGTPRDPVLQCQNQAPPGPCRYQYFPAFVRTNYQLCAWLSSGGVDPFCNTRVCNDTDGTVCNYKVTNP